MFIVPKTAKQWLAGAIAAFVSAAANGVGVVIVAPETFNLDKGLYKLFEVCVVFGIVGLAAFLKTHPIPDEDETTKGF